jgi:diketogulonate reductase-like aldo/keto reductase
MRYETLHDEMIPKVGFGTWSIGGKSLPDPSQDARSLVALRSALELGYRHFDTAEMYAAGHAEELLGQAIRETGIPRETLFITSKVSPEHLEYQMILACCEASLRRLGIEVLDLYLIHWPRRGMDLAQAFKALNHLVVQGKVRHVGVSNFNLELLKRSVEYCETPLFTNQVSYSLPDRTYARNGVLEYCQQNAILLTAYSPVKHRFTRGIKVKALAKQHGISPEQLALAWLVRQPRLITIPMSFNPQHQAENLAAADIDLSDDELLQLG